MNQVNLVARTTRDPELRYLQNGTAVANLSVAINSKFKKDESFFFECKAWSKTAELLAEYIRKGDQIGITGELQQQRWDNDNGEKRSKVIINIESITFVGSKKE